MVPPRHSVSQPNSKRMPSSCGSGRMLFLCIFSTLQLAVAALAGIAAITYVGVITQVQPGLGDEFNNNAIASCVMGGTSMAGGVASMGGTVIGVFIISLLRVGIQAMGFRPDYQYIITGVIVALAVFADIRSSGRRK